MSRFSTIGLIGRPGSTQVVDSLNILYHFLLAKGISVFLETETAALLERTPESTCDRDSLGKRCDLVIVVGGDGSMLGAARTLCNDTVPVLGINRGNLGFLTDILPDEIEQKVAQVLAGEYVREERFLLDAFIFRDGKLIDKADAMNEVVIHRGTSLRMIEFALEINQQFVYSQHSDGLIVSTPTGSTAYSLSGGGPILHPALDAVSLVPMFPHTLTSRPLVVGGGSMIKVTMGDYQGGQPQLSCDGQTHIGLHEGDEIHITKKPHTLSLIHPCHHDFYETCRTKLGWGSRLS